MKNGQVALALTAGYALGRTHKMRWALALAGITAAGRGMGAGRLAAGAAKSPELSRLTHDVREQLMSAGRKAVVATASNRMDSLSDRLQSRTESLRVKPEAEETEESEEPEDREETPDEEDTEEEDEGAEEEQAPKKRAPAKKTSSSSPRKKPSGASSRRSGE
ncbi:hypothetical protein FBY35_4079 [Streptomyces sp. SLBN-118]|uniref:hypothetical protein n=1 Tax=Streptomyces sp. SLBN-118 TaxID=2768454 RepID=UPI00115207E6|nr:hypothetical protein [Streptomyces sp. SLBN-118]TQK42651.1 hypothetical protein FBY35_4079 [Streptomyces sp. SLBN-118]